MIKGELSFLEEKLLNCFGQISNNLTPGSWVAMVKYS